MVKAIAKKKTGILITALILSAIFIAAIPFIASAVCQKTMGGEIEKEAVASKKDNNGSSKGGGGSSKGGGVQKIDTGYHTKVIGTKGGYIQVDKDIYFVVPDGALKDDVEIGVRMKRDRKEKKTKFYFVPAGLEFSRPATLQAYWEAIGDAAEEEPGLQYAVESDGLLYDVGSAIRPGVEAWGVTWKIKHFSLYYYRRR